VRGDRIIIITIALLLCNYVKYRCLKSGGALVFCIIGYFDSNFLGDNQTMRTAKDRARAHVAYRLRIGAIRKPPACEECRTLGQVEAHHPDYGSPGRVVWLCRSCHAAKRRRVKVQAVAMSAAIAFAALAWGGCAAMSEWMQQQEAAGVDVPGTISETVTTGAILLPSPWREIAIGLAGIAGTVLMALSKRKLKRELSGV